MEGYDLGELKSKLYHKSYDIWILLGYNNTEYEGISMLDG